MLTLLALHVFIVAVLAIGVEAGCRLGRFRPAVRHALWLVVLIKLCLPPVLPWPSLFEDMFPESPRVLNEIGFVLTSDSLSPNGESVTGIAVNPSASKTVPEEVHQQKARTELPFATLFLSAWGVGALFVAGRNFDRIRRFRMLLASADSAPGWLRECSNELAEVIGVRPPEILTATGLASAVVWNPLRSKVLVSKELFDVLSRDEWRGIIAHELAHLKRGDLWVGWFELVAVCLWWWNPLMGIIRQRLHLYAELACDAWVLWALPESGCQYAKVLFRIASEGAPCRVNSPAFGMASGSVASFRARLALLLQGGAPRQVPKTAVIAIAALLISVAPAMTPTVRAEKKARSGSPVVFEKLQTPENTHGAEAVMETRIYVTKDRVKGLGNDSGKPSNGCGTPQLSILKIANSPQETKVSSVPIKMAGTSLSWNGEDEPKSLGIVHVASPSFALRPKDLVSVSMGLPCQVLDWLKIERPSVLKMTASREKERVASTLTLFPQDEPQDCTAQTSFNLGLVSEEWTFSEIEILGEGNRRARILLFAKLTPVESAQPERELPVPAHGEFTISHIKKEPIDPSKVVYVTLKHVEASVKDVEEIASGLKRISDAETKPGDLRLYSIPNQDEYEKLFKRLNNAPGATLVSAPSVSFIVEQAPIKTLGNANVDTFFDNSPLFKSYAGDMQAKVLIGEYLSELFPAKIGEKPEEISYGTFFAIDSDSEIRDGALGMHFCFCSKDLVRHETGRFLWKKELRPDVVETAADVKLRQRFGEALCFIVKDLDPKKLRMVFLVVDQREDILSK
jgi:beta-lactamase regulating signal transducer with metallopeptidase domain